MDKDTTPETLTLTMIQDEIERRGLRPFDICRYYKLNQPHVSLILRDKKPMSKSYVGLFFTLFRLLDKDPAFELELIKTRG